MALALGALQRRVGLSSWCLAQDLDGQWVLLDGLSQSSEGPLAGARERGATLPPDLSMCAELTRRGPLAIADTHTVPALTALGDRLRTSAYIGVALRTEGEVLGALIGADLHPWIDGLAEELPFVELLAEMLSALLAAELHAQRQARRADAATVASLRDPLTGLGNRRLWDRLLATEEERCRRHGTDASVAIIDIDGLKVVNDEQGHAAGDALIRATAAVVAEQTRAPDVAARIGGDEFAVVATNCGPHDTRALVERLRAALGAQGITASIGYAARSETGDLQGAWTRADAAMYIEKQIRHARAAAAPR